MPSTEQIIVACASCETQYNVSTMAPGAKFKCKKCGTINIVPEFEEPVQEETPPPPPPPPPPSSPKPQVRTQTKTPINPALAPPKPAPPRVAPSRVSSGFKKGLAPKGKRLAKTQAEDTDGNTAEDAKNIGPRKGLLAPENRKYLFIGGTVALILVAAVYVIHSRNVTKKNNAIAEKATKAINSINESVSKKDFVNALEKSEAFVREFGDSDIPAVKKNADNTKLSIQGITQQIEREKEGKAKLASLMDKKNDATPDQYEDLMKEFNKFMGKYAEFYDMFEKAKSEASDLEAKITAKEEEEDNKIFNDLLAEIKPMVDGGKIDEAIAHLTKYKDANKLSKRLQGAFKKKISELKAKK